MRYTSCSYSAMFGRCKVLRFQICREAPTEEVIRQALRGKRFNSKFGSLRSNYLTIRFQMGKLENEITQAREEDQKEELEQLKKQLKSLTRAITKLAVVVVRYKLTALENLFLWVGSMYVLCHSNLEPT